MRSLVLLCCTLVLWYAAPATTQAFEASRVFEPPPILTNPDNADFEGFLDAIVENLPSALDVLNDVRSNQDRSVARILDIMDSFVGIIRRVMASMSEHSGQPAGSTNLKGLTQTQLVLRAFGNFMSDLTDAGIIKKSTANVTKTNIPPITLKDLTPLLQALMEAVPENRAPSPTKTSVTPVQQIESYSHQAPVRAVQTIKSSNPIKGTPQTQYGQKAKGINAPVPIARQARTQARARPAVFPPAFQTGEPLPRPIRRRRRYRKARQPEE